MKAILDTSVFIAREQSRPLGELPEEAAISVLTLAELHVGVLMAPSGLRAQRLRTVAEVERTFDALPVDAAVARAFADIVAQAKRKGKRPKIIDALVAATAKANDVAVYTQDEDFKKIPGVRVVII